MQSKITSMKTEIYMLVLFLLGSNSAIGISWGVGQDNWISIILALGFGSIFILMYARINSLFPEKNLYDITESIFGKIIGKIITVLIIVYAIYLSTIVIKLISEFIKIVNLVETPVIPIMILLVIAAAYLTFSGINTLKKWSTFVFPIYFLILMYILIASMSEMKCTNLLPIFEHSIIDIVKASLKILSTTFAGTILFLTFEDFIRSRKNPYMIYFWGVFIAMLILISIFLISAMVLGIPMLESSYFPIYTVARLISIGDFLSRIEMIIFFNFLLACIAKISICLSAAVKGVKCLFDNRNEGLILFILSISVLVISILGFNSIMDLLNFLDFYQIYILFFQILIPAMIWVGAELKVSKIKRG